MTVTEPTTAQRVAKGVAWLDRQVPGWEDLVQIQNLNMASTCNCVLGWTFKEAPVKDTPEARVWLRELRESDRVPGYWKAVKGLTGRHKPKPPGWAVAHGFDKVVGREESYADLRAEWERVIRERREAAAAATPTWATPGWSTWGQP